MYAGEVQHIKYYAATCESILTCLNCNVNKFMDQQHLA